MGGEFNKTSALKTCIPMPPPTRWNQKFLRKWKMVKMLHWEEIVKTMKKVWYKHMVRGVGGGSERVGLSGLDICHHYSTLKHQWFFVCVSFINMSKMKLKSHHIAQNLNLSSSWSWFCWVSLFNETPFCCFPLQWVHLHSLANKCEISSSSLQVLSSSSLFYLSSSELSSSSFWIFYNLAPSSESVWHLTDMPTSAYVKNLEILSSWY